MTGLQEQKLPIRSDVRSVHSIGGGEEEETESMPVALAAAISSTAVVLLAVGTTLVTVLLVVFRKKRLNKTKTRPVTAGVIATTGAPQLSSR